MILFFFITAALLIVLFLYRRDRRYRTSKYRDVASDEMKKNLNLKTHTDTFAQEFSPGKDKRNLSRKMLEELNEKKQGPS